MSVKERIKEMRKREREEMNPIRYKMNHYGNPIFFTLIVLALLSIAIVGERATNELWCLLPAGVTVLLLGTLVAVSETIKKKELETELKRWEYLFKTDVSFEENLLHTDDVETGIEYDLTPKGMKVILPIKGEQVFDEVKENEFFLPWDDVEIALATDNYARRVRFAFAVIDVSKQSADGEYTPTEKDVHFLPLEEELIGFLRRYDLERKVSVEWRYLQRQPSDAFRQIMEKGYIATLIDENGKRVKREKADGLYVD